MFVRWPRPLRAAAALTAALLFAGCGPSSEIDRLGEARGPISGPFYVSEYFAPSGHMGDGQLPGHIKALIGEDALTARRQWCDEMVQGGFLTREQCPERPVNPDGTAAGGDAYAFIYTPSELLWAGVYWVHPANNWGAVPGRMISPNYRHTRVRFWAASDTAGIPTQAIIGGITDPNLEFKDGFRGAIYPTLTHEYQQFEIPIREQYDISMVIGAFCWVTNYDAGTDYLTAPPRTIFIDDIVWE